VNIRRLTDQVGFCAALARVARRSDHAIPTWKATEAIASPERSNWSLAAAVTATTVKPAATSRRIVRTQRALVRDMGGRGVMAIANDRRALSNPRRWVLVIQRHAVTA